MTDLEIALSRVGTGYVYPDEVDPSVRQELEGLKTEIFEHNVNTIDTMLATGACLSQVKGKLADRHFGPWIESNCDFSRRTATRYIHLFTTFGTSIAGVVTQRALIELSEDGVSQQARDEAIRLANSTFVTSSVAKDVIDRTDGEPPEGAEAAPGGEAQPASEPSAGEAPASSAGENGGAEPPAPPRQPVVAKAADSKGRELPDELVSIFAKASEFDNARKILRQLKRWADEISEKPAGMVLERSMLQARRDIQNLDNAFFFSKPYAVCSYCDAEVPGIANCRACHGSGWLVKPVYDQSPVAREAARRAAAEKAAAERAAEAEEANQEEPDPFG